MSMEEFEEIVPLGNDFYLHAVESDLGFVTFRTTRLGSAPAPGAQKRVWVRTSFRDDKAQHDAALQLAHALGLSYCEWLRLLEAQEIEKYGIIAAQPWQKRRRPIYVG